MLRFLPVLIQLGLMIFCLIDCIQTDSERVRNLPKIGWILLILFFPIVGGVAWLVAGRPKPQPAGPTSWRPAEPAAAAQNERPHTARPDTSDIDEQLRQDQERVDREYDEALKKWEASRRNDPETGPQKS